MKYSTATRYGLRIMVYLGVNYGSGPIQLSEIAEHEDVSVKYLEQIVRKLMPSSLIQSVRGAKGGYKLTKEPAEISVKDIFCALEDGCEPIACLKTGQECSRVGLCSTIDLWEGLQEVIENYLLKISLADLVRNYLKKTRKALLKQGM